MFTAACVGTLVSLEPFEELVLRPELSTLNRRLEKLVWNSPRSPIRYVILTY